MRPCSLADGIRGDDLQRSLWSRVLVVGVEGVEGSLRLEGRLGSGHQCTKRVLAIGRGRPRRGRAPVSPGALLVGTGRDRWRILAPAILFALTLTVFLFSLVRISLTVVSGILTTRWLDPFIEVHVSLGNRQK